MRFSRYYFAIIITLFCNSLFAQSDNQAFQSTQLTFPRVSSAYAQYSNVLKKEFENKQLSYPPKEIYLRSFKSENELEVWVKNSGQDTFSLFKVYKVCALSGVLGPKRWEGDRQVPEGFYFIDNFNPNSDFLLSMLVNYPNYSDLILSNKTKPGGDIYIHGGCYTVGCLPMTDDGIKELYTLCMMTKGNGQSYIPIHIFPVKFNKVGLNFLGREYQDDEPKHRFWINLKAGYDYFEKNRKVYPVMYNEEGKYVF